MTIRKQSGAPPAPEDLRKLVAVAQTVSVHGHRATALMIELLDRLPALSGGDIAVALKAIAADAWLTETVRLETEAYTALRDLHHDGVITHDAIRAGRDLLIRVADIRVS